MLTFANRGSVNLYKDLGRARVLCVCWQQWRSKVDPVLLWRQRRDSPYLAPDRFSTWSVCSLSVLLLPVAELLTPPPPLILWLIFPPAPSISILLRVSVRLWTFLFLCEFCAFVNSKNIDKLCASVKDILHFTSLADFISFRRYRSQRRVSLYAKSIRPIARKFQG